MVSFGLCAMAQEPAKAETKVSGNTKVTFSSNSAPMKDKKNDRIHVTPNNVIQYGKDNVVKISVDKIQDKQLIVKVVSEDLCDFRKGSTFGEYVFTPKAREGEVTVRVGYMDVLGAYQNLGNIQLIIGGSQRPANGNVRPSGEAERVNSEPQRGGDRPADNKTITSKRTTTTVEETVVQ